MGKKIHLIFKTHLDVGFTNYGAAVVARYFNEYFPAAMALARELRESSRPERYVWTTGSWLIYQYLEQADLPSRRRMEEAILAGDIRWHALPFTTHTELMDVDLFRRGLSLSQKLDRRFGFTTTAAKMTDVPGHTRGVVPLLVEAGIQFLHIGVNPGSTVPNVPPLFRWRDLTGAEIVVMIESGYGSASAIPGVEDVLAFDHTSDNLGPQNVDEVLAVYQNYEKAHPGAQVMASSLTDFAACLQPVKDSLPVVTEEIGDTWIHGLGSDPIKVSQFRELLRLRKQWLVSNPSLREDERFIRFEEGLLLIPEHTWGMDEKTFLADYEHYDKESFVKVRSKENFRCFESSWSEKREYIQQAVNHLGDLPQRHEALNQLAVMHPQKPDFSTWEQVEMLASRFRTPFFEIGFEEKTGAINYLFQNDRQKLWFDQGHCMGLFSYQTFSAADYERFFQQYIREEERQNGWSREDFTKPGLEKTNAESLLFSPQVESAFYRDEPDADKFLFRLSTLKKAFADYGFPREVFLQYSFLKNSPTMRMCLQWFHKEANRMPEAFWLGFSPLGVTNSSWRFKKLGQWISPLDVVTKGNRHLHAVDDEVQFGDGAEVLQIFPLDSPLAAPGKPSLLNFTQEQPDLSAGVHFNLYNNVWGTNFPMWFEENCRFRFEVKFNNSK